MRLSRKTKFRDQKAISMPVIPDEAKRRSGIQSGSGGFWIALTLHCVPRLRGNDAYGMGDSSFHREPLKRF